MTPNPIDPAKLLRLAEEYRTADAVVKRLHQAQVELRNELAKLQEETVRASKAAADAVTALNNAVVAGNVAYQR